MNPWLAFLLSSAFEGALAPAHRADLDKSGITEASRVAQGIRSMPPSDFAKLLGFKVPAAVTSLMSHSSKEGQHCPMKSQPSGSGHLRCEGGHGAGVLLSPKHWASSTSPSAAV